MDFEPNDDQRAVLEALDLLLDRHAGTARAIELQRKGGYDGELDDALAEAGFSTIADAEGMGPLAAALVVESVALAAGQVAISARALVAAAVVEGEAIGPVALASARQPGPTRYAAHARTLLIEDGDEARMLRLTTGDCPPVASNFGYPMGAVTAELASRGESLGPGSGARLRCWWRVALAVEAVGTMRAALDQTVGYVKERRQFGQAIGSFQAVQHRLAGCAIAVEGSRWLALEAAHHGAPDEASATACAYALTAAAQVFAETHQLSGAIGFTREHDLHVFSMRLQALRLELGGVTGHRRALAAARWGRR